MTTTKPIAEMTAEEKVILKAKMLATELDDSDVFPGSLGNKINAFVNKPLRRSELVTKAHKQEKD